MAVCSVVLLLLRLMLSRDACLHRLHRLGRLPVQQARVTCLKQRELNAFSLP